MIPLAKPDVGFQEIEEVTKVLKSGILSLGPKIRNFEQSFASHIGTKYAVGVNSGTSGLHLAVRSLNLKEGDEVITTPFSFIASSNCLLYEDVTPVFVDVEEESFNIDPSKIEAAITKNTKALLIAHIFGQSCNMTQIMKIAKKYNLKIIEDACESIDAVHYNQKTGTFGDVAVFAFYPNKQMTTGEGGMVSSNIEEIVDIARSFAWWGRDCYCVGPANLLPKGTCKNRFDKWLPEVNAVIDHKYLFSNIGYNLKPLDMQGAVGIEQLNKIDEIHRLRRLHKKIIANYISSYIEGVRVVEEHKQAETSWFGVPIVCDTANIKENLVKHLENNKIQTRSYFAGNILLHPAYKNLDNASNYPIANSVLENVFFIGCSPTYSSNMLDYIKSVLLKFKSNNINVITDNTE